MKAPKAKQIPHQFENHGVVRNDPYYWMRERDHPDVISHLQTENEYTAQILKPYADLENKLFEEIKARIKKEDASVPYRDRGDFYYSRVGEGQEYDVHCRRRGSLQAQEEILLDCNLRAKDKDYYSCAGLDVSPTGKYLAFAEDFVGRRIYSIRFKDLTTQEILELEISGTTGNLVWSEVEGILFYVTQNEESLRWEKVWRFDLRANKSELVFEEKDEKFYVGVSKSLSDRFIFIESDSKTSSETWILPADNPLEKPRCFLPREPHHEYSIDDGMDRFYILTNESAKNFKIMSCALDQTAKEAWREVVPHRDSVYVEDFECYKDFLCIQEREDGLGHLRILSRTSSDDYRLPFRDAAYVVDSDVNSEFDTSVFRYSYESMTTPESIFEWDLSSKTSKLLKQDEVVGGHEPSEYVSERFFIEVRDGASVPVSLVYKKGTPRSSTTPLVLYGYGSYGASEEPSFSFSRLSLLNRGFVFAIAHVRGGSEMGRHWYEGGKFLKKKNTFYDFIDIAESLIARGYTSSRHLYAMGGSAGGLLMGAVMNERPDLFRGVVAAVPFVDVVTTMLDETIPLTTYEYEEWGNPKDSEYFHYMLSYSPYENVKAQAYPNLLVTSGYHDSQVQYWEPTKWVARLRDLKTDSHLILLYTDLSVGHSGPSGRFEAYRLIAKEFLFFLMLESAT
jgi:oligopeptidase B